jgi:murein DD-endopeptidase MepM/ murein hydrolase activator NlpD
MLDGRRLRPALLAASLLALAISLLSSATAGAVTPAAESVFGAAADTATSGATQPISATKRRRRHSHRRRIRNTKDLGRSAAPAVGGGFSTLAPWPAGVAFVAGGECGFFMKGSAHRDYGGQWDDDRKAIDFGKCGASDFGTPILAAHSGTVQLAEEDSAYGKTVVIEMTKNGFATRYAHLQKLSVKKKQKVQAGQQIGTLGHSAAGEKNNAHLHFVAYKNRKPHAGTAPSPMASLDLCDGCLVESLTQKGAGQNPFQAAVQSVTLGNGGGGHAEVAPGQLLEFGFAVRFAEAFDAERFVMRPASPDVARFTTTSGDLLGALTGLGGDTGAYGGLVHVPAGTPDGEYALSWDAVNTATGQLGNARATLTLKVKAPPGAPAPPKVFPLPRPGAPDWEATTVGLDYPRIIAPGEQAEVVVKLQNTGTAIWDSKVRLASANDAAIRHLVDGLGQNRVNSTDEDGNGFVVPGEIATFRYLLNSSQATAYRQTFALARDSAGGVKFGSVQVPTVIADEGHWPPELTHADCTWKFQSQAGGLAADGQSGQFTFTIQNDSALCPWFRGGVRPFGLGTSRSQDRTSRFRNPGDGAWNGGARILLPHRVAPGESVSITFSLRPDASVTAAQYAEYFTPVIDGFAWLADLGMYAPLDSSVTFLAPTSTVAVPKSGEKIVEVSVLNRTGRTWQRGQDNIHFVDPNGNDLSYPHCGPNPAGWLNGNAVQFTAPTVAPGQTAVYQMRVCGEGTYTGPATLRVRYVHEGVSHYNPIHPISLQIG